MPTQKRHIYETGTVNVETGDVAVKEDINYYNAKAQSATRSVIRFMEDSDRRFKDNQIYDGCTVSDGGSTVDVASGTAMIGGRWVTIDATNLSAAVSDDTYYIVAELSGVSETNSRDPSTGESVTVSLVADGSFAATDFKLVLGQAVIASSAVSSVSDRAVRRVRANAIFPYGNATSVKVYTGTKPIYGLAVDFQSTKIVPNLPIETAFNISGSNVNIDSLDVTNIAEFKDVYTSGLMHVSGSQTIDGNQDVGGNATVDGTQHIGGNAVFSGTMNVEGNAVFSGTMNVVGAYSGSADVSATSFTIGSKTLAWQEFNNLDGLDQQVNIGTSPSFNAPSLTAPVIGSFISSQHNHASGAAGGTIDILNGTTNTLSVARGGTGVTSLTDGGIVLGSATSAVTVTSRPTTGQILVGQPAGDPTLQASTITLTGEVTGSDTMDENGDFSIATALDVPSTTIYMPLNLHSALLGGSASLGATSISLPTASSVSWYVSLHDQMFSTNFAYSTITLVAITFYATGVDFDCSYTYISGSATIGSQTTTLTPTGTRTFDITDRTISGTDMVKIVLDGVASSSANIWSAFLQITIS